MIIVGSKAKRYMFDNGQTWYMSANMVLEGAKTFLTLSWLLNWVL